MKPRSRAEIWKQQKYNNSCFWDCLSMLLKTQGVETTSLELVGASQVPYQMRFHPEEKKLSAGMLVQEDRNADLVLAKYGFKLKSKRVSTIPEYIDLAKETLLAGEAFVTSIKRPDNLPGRHAVVFTEFGDSHFLGLDPDCRLDRSVDYCFDQVKDTVALGFKHDELTRLVSGDEGYVPLLGVLSPCESHEPEQETLEDVFKTSEKALKFYSSAIGGFDFGTEKSLPAIHSVLKPVVTDLRTAIEIRDEYLNEDSEIASFLRLFEREILEFRRLDKIDEAIPEKLKTGLGTSLLRSCSLLDEHLSFEMYGRKVAPITALTSRLSVNRIRVDGDNCGEVPRSCPVITGNPLRDP